MLATKCEVSVYLMAFYWCLLCTPSISILYTPHPISLLPPSTSILHTHIHLLYSSPPPPPPIFLQPIYPLFHPSILFINHIYTPPTPSILYSIQQSSSSIPSTPPPLSPTHLSYIPSNNPLHQSHLTPTPTLLFPPPIYPLFHPSIFSVEEIQVQVTKKIFCLKWYVKWNTGAKLWIHTKFHNFLLAARVLRSLRAKWCLSNKGLKMKAYTFSYQSGCCNFKLCIQNTTITAQWDGGLSTSIYLGH